MANSSLLGGATILHITFPFEGADYLVYLFINLHGLGHCSRRDQPLAVSSCIYFSDGAPGNSLLPGFIVLFRDHENWRHACIGEIRLTHTLPCDSPRSFST